MLVFLLSFVYMSTGKSNVYLAPGAFELLQDNLQPLAPMLGKFGFCFTSYLEFKLFLFVICNFCFRRCVARARGDAPATRDGWRVWENCSSRKASVYSFAVSRRSCSQVRTTTDARYAELWGENFCSSTRTFGIVSSLSTVLVLLEFDFFFVFREVKEKTSGGRTMMFGDLVPLNKTRAQAGKTFYVLLGKDCLLVSCLYSWSIASIVDLVARRVVFVRQEEPYAVIEISTKSMGGKRRVWICEISLLLKLVTHFLKFVPTFLSC